MRIYNDHGLRYEVIQPIHVKDPFFGRTNLVSEQAQVRGSFGLKGAFDTASRPFQQQLCALDRVYVYDLPDAVPHQHGDALDDGD